MKKHQQAMEVFLQPGEHYFGDRDTRIRTILGSCVAVTIWHPKLLVGGMCHYMLPARSRPGSALDGKYADEALQLLLDEANRIGTFAKDYQIKLFGGGHMFPHAKKQQAAHVGSRNVDAARMLLRKHGLPIHAEHLGGDGHRNVIFDLWSGDVWMRHQQPSCRNCDDCEARPICRQAA